MTALPQIISIAILLSLAACQSPVVPVRSYTYSASFVADGREYTLSTSYQCHYEDVAWVSERGPGWHIRKGASSVRITGRLDDGTPFEVRPSPDTQDVFCSDHRGEVVSQLFLATLDGDVAGISLERDKNAPHHGRLLVTKLSLIGTGSEAFSERKRWPEPSKPAQRFYTVQATYYDNTLWKREQDIVAMVCNKAIRWLDDASIWPFLQWTDADVAVARARQSIKQLSGYNDAGKRFSVSTLGSGWRFIGPNNDVTVWHPVQTQTNLARWVEYAGHRIELPLRNSNRLFYEKESDQLIEFRIVYVDLW